VVRIPLAAGDFRVERAEAILHGQLRAVFAKQIARLLKLLLGCHLYDLAHNPPIQTITDTYPIKMPPFTFSTWPVT